MSDFSLSDAIKGVTDFLNYRTSSRRELFATEFETLCSEFLAQQEYLLNETDVIIRVLEMGLESLQVIGTNNIQELIDPLMSNIQEAVDQIRLRRNEGKVARLTVFEIAQDRETYDYFKNNIIRIVTDDERETFRQFFRLIYSRFQPYLTNPTEMFMDPSDDPRIAESSDYQHELRTALLYTDGIMQSLRSIANAPDHFSIDQLKKQMQSVVSELKDLQSAGEREAAQVAALGDRIRRDLTGK